MTAPPIKRSYIEFAKRVFLDRLTCYSQPLLQPDPGNIDEGPGDQYDYSAVGSAVDFGIGFDCSGWCGIGCGIALNGPNYFGATYSRLFSTETFPGPLVGFRQTSQADLVNNYYPVKVCICHGGGGPNSHMNMTLDGITMESNGDDGLCTLGHGALSPGDNYWNDWWVYDGPINEDSTWRCNMTYPQGLDYAGGAIAGVDLKSAGKEFVCRYVSDGGSGLPGKLLQPAEFQDLLNNGIEVHFNWETTAQMMLGDTAGGVSDATAALAYINNVLGVDLLRDPRAVVYFSCDFDEAPGQDVEVFDYLDGATTVLGMRPDGKRRAALYGPYYVGNRALDAGKTHFFWQTEAWSSSDDGTHIDYRVNIMQRNNAGYQTIDGIQCDYNEKHIDDSGGYLPAVAPIPAPIPTPTPEPIPVSQPADYLALTYEQVAGPRQADGYGHGWPQLQGLTVVDYLAQVVGPGIKQIQTTLTSMQSKPAVAPTPSIKPPLHVPVPGEKK